MTPRPAISEEARAALRELVVGLFSSILATLGERIGEAIADRIKAATSAPAPEDRPRRTL